ncbi:unnamed protein product [Orchesella dallaii]|uniref:Uncharacterized protein n=1 Tax=Orchesella dallaii TaxID=48710 RepID=A0ABP1RLE5_9HEXA
MISHFTNTHKKLYHQEGCVLISGKSIQTFFLNSLPGQEKHGGCLCSLTNEETSPLFFVVFKVNNTNEVLSLNCVHVWGTEENKFKVEFSFVRTSSSSFTSISTDPLLICWTLNVCTLTEVRNNKHERCPIHVHIPSLREINFGDNDNDSLCVNISQIT